MAALHRLRSDTSGFAKMPILSAFVFQLLWECGAQLIDEAKFSLVLQQLLRRWHILCLTMTQLVATRKLGGFKELGCQRRLRMELWFCNNCWDGDTNRTLLNILCLTMTQRIQAQPPSVCTRLQNVSCHEHWYVNAVFYWKFVNIETPVLDPG